MGHKGSSKNGERVAWVPLSPDPSVVACFDQWCMVNEVEKDLSKRVCTPCAAVHGRLILVKIDEEGGDSCNFE